MSSTDLINDRRLQMPTDNVFRFCQPTDLPHMDLDTRGKLSFETAKVSHRARLETKLMTLANKGSDNE